MRSPRGPRRTGILAATVGVLLTGMLLAAPAGRTVPAGRAVSPQPAAAGTGLTAAAPQGGDAVYAGAYRCTLAFNVRDGSGAHYFIGAGHCGASVGSIWYADLAHTKTLGTTVAVSASGDGVVIVKYAAGIVPPGGVDLYNGASQDIVSAAAAYVGEPARRSGPTTGLHSGSVTAINATVNFPEGTLTGLIRTNICAEPGDLGGPLFDGTKALGILVGSTGNCSSGGTTYYQPITKILAAYGLSVY